MAARKEVRPAKNPKGFRQRFLPPQVPRANARKRRRASFPATLGGPLVGCPLPRTARQGGPSPRPGAYTPTGPNWKLGPAPREAHLPH